MSINVRIELNRFTGSGELSMNANIVDVFVENSSSLTRIIHNIYWFVVNVIFGVKTSDVRFSLEDKEKGGAHYFNLKRSELLTFMHRQVVSDKNLAYITKEDVSKMMSEACKVGIHQEAQNFTRFAGDVLNRAYTKAVTDKMISGGQAVVNTTAAAVQAARDMFNAGVRFITG